MTTALRNIFTPKHGHRGAHSWPPLLGMLVLCLISNGCSTPANQPSQLPAQDQSVVVIYLESKNKNVPITAVYYQDTGHKAGHQPMNTCKLDQGVACWISPAPPGAFTVTGWDCTFLGDKRIISVGGTTVVNGPRSVLTIRGRFPIASTTVTEPAVYFLGSYQVDPGQAREGGHVYGTTKPVELAEPPELSVLLQLTEKTKDNAWHTVVNRRIEQIRTFHKTSARAK